jgi:ABC-type Fe3+ transport system permease subunit
MIIPGFGQLYANAVVLGVIFVVAWTIPFWLILFSFLIPGLTSLGQGAPLDGVPLDEDPAAPAASPFAGLIQSARFYLIFLLLVWVGAMVHAWFAARKFNRTNGIELR